MPTIRTSRPSKKRCRASIRRLVTVGGLLVVVFAMASTPAFASRNHSFAHAFGSKGTGAGQMQLAAPVPSPGGNGGDETGGSGLALNTSAHDIYVADTDNHRVDEYTTAGAFVRAFGYGVLNGKHELQTCTSTCREGISGPAPGQLETPTFIAVDNNGTGAGDLYVGDTGDNLITKYTATGALVKSWGNHGTGETPNGQLAGPPTESFAILFGIAVAATTGNLWVDGSTGGGATMYEYEQSGTYTGANWPAEAEPSGLAINGAEELYVTDGAPDVRKFTSAGTPLGYLFPVPSANITGMNVDVTGEAVYLDMESTVEEVAGSCPPPAEKCQVLESFGAPTLTGGAGIGVDPSTDVVFVANTTGNAVDAFALEPASPPLVTEEADADVTATSANLIAEVNPKSLEGEEETTYYFKYGPCSTPSTCATSPYTSKTGTGVISASFNASSIEAQVTQLEPGTAYHYRLVAENAVTKAQKTPAEGEEQVFTSQNGGGFKLPDERVWEMVSPAEKRGALIEPLDQEGVIEAAADGQAITYHANQPFELEPEGAMNQVQMLSTRTSTGWSTRGIEPPHTIAGKPEGEGEPYRFFSEDLNVALVQPAGAFDEAVTKEASEQTPLLRTNYFNANVDEPCIPSPEVSCYRALVTGKEGYANVPPGTKFGEEEAAGGRFGPCPQSTVFCGPQMLGASSNGEHVVLRSYAQLTSQSVSGSQLYEWSDGKLSLVSVMPNGEPVPTSNAAIFGNNDGRGTRNAISSSGSRVIWSYGGEIYLRDTDPVSSKDPEAETTTLIGPGEFETANSEDTEVYFTNGGDLYRYDVDAGLPATQLTNNADVLGSVIGVSQDGSYIYFVANGALESAGEGAVTGDCNVERKQEQKCNLFVEHDGVTKLVAVLSGADSPDWANGEANLTNLTARVSPNGQYLAFMSDRDLVGYSPVDAVADRSDEEVYLYDSLRGHLACASCEVTGGRPHGIEYLRELGHSEITRNMPFVGGDEIWQATSMMAAVVPGGTPFKIERAAYQSRYLSNSGRLFFDSIDPLVPNDVNGTWDVYEYEPEGLGSEPGECGPGTANGSNAFKPDRAYVLEGRQGEEPAGCVGLISSGTATEESAFLDASETGSDVFFLTTARLAAQDTDDDFDIYDAHECTAKAPCSQASMPIEAAPCEGERECRGAPSSQPDIFGAPSSSTFAAEGNLAPAKPAGVAKETRSQRLAKSLKSCRKRYAKANGRRRACERAARAKFGKVEKKAGKKK
jgi:hypothetical protein